MATEGLAVGIGLGQPPPAKIWRLASKAGTCLVMSLVKFSSSHMAGKLRQKPSSRDGAQIESGSASQMWSSWARFSGTW